MAAERDDAAVGHPVVIRSAVEEDAGAIADIYNEAVRTTTATFDTEPRSLRDQVQWLKHHDARHPVLVAELDGTVVGWSSLSAWSERCAYSGTAELSVYVRTAWQNRRIGRALLRAIFKEASRLGFHTILARVAEGNPASRRLHLSAGFSTVGVMHEVGYKFDRFLDVELLECRVGVTQRSP